LQSCLTTGSEAFQTFSKKAADPQKLSTAHVGSGTMKVSVRRRKVPLPPLQGLLLFAWVLSAQEQSPAPAPPAKPDPVFSLAAGQNGRHTVPLEAGQFVRLRVERRGADHVVLLDPSGKPVIERDSMFDPGYIQVLALPSSTGTYALEVYGGPKPSSYSWRILEQRAARESDRRLIEAQSKQNEAMERMGKVNEAEPRMLEALRSWETAGNEPQGVIDSLAGLCHISRYLGKAQSQRDFAARLLEVSTKEGNQHALSHAHYHLGIAWAELGNLALGMDHLEKAVEISVRNNDAKGQSTALNILGGLLSRAGQSKRALEYFNRALTIFRDLGNKRFIAASLLSSGSTHLELDQYTQGVVPLQEALEIYRELKDPLNEAVVLRYLANAASRLGQNDKATSLFEESLALLRKQESLPGLANTLTALGAHLANMREWERAVVPLEEALALYRSNPQAPVNPGTLNWLARVETERGNLDRAQALGEEMINELESRRARAGGGGARDQFFNQVRPAR
jgi:tetratricopeptide (TPR) repeat protein